ncbi:MAG TPA: FAD-binding protein [Streptosporangiaceae bacterium]
MPQTWDLEADVVVIGFGAAGACAALEAASAGATVILIDRFSGGGATALSGGVVYAGGGTVQQLQAGVSDSVGAMFRYLQTEVGDAVTAATLRDFCDGSVAMLAWLSSKGVPFSGSLCPEKTSYPTDRHYLYYSGSERSFAHVATPAPRGHRAVGRGTSGRVLFAGLADSVRSAGIDVAAQTRADRLVTGAAGEVTGVACLSLRGAPGWVRFAHRTLHKLGKKPFLYAGGAGRRLHKPVAYLERRFAAPLLIGARRGVVIAAGGFVANRALLREHAPAYRGGLPLGTVADDGSGIGLGVTAGGVTRFMDRVSCWRFISPPSAFLGGLLVDRAGQRVCDESLYGAAIGEAMMSRDRRAWLLLDRAAVSRSWRQLRGSTQWFQLLQAVYLLTRARVTGRTVAEAAAKAGVDADGLAATLAAYNAAATAGEPDAAGKPADVVTVLGQPPYSLIDLAIRPRPAYPAPMLTLGGLAVAEDSGEVLRADGTRVTGLYAAGRSAVGLCSRSYVSGLSLADCVYSGRRAGRHAAVTRTASSPRSSARPSQ